MHLGDQRETPALEALGHPQLPERARTIERRAQDAPGQVGELARATRRRAGDAPQVMDEIEVRVVDPRGVIEMKGYLHEAPVKARLPACFALDDGRHARMIVRPARDVRVEDRDQPHVHVHRRGFQVQEGRVQS